MAKNLPSADYRRSVVKLFELLQQDKHRLYAIYGFAIFGGLVQLSLPLGIQTIISLVQGGKVTTSIILLIAFVVAGVFLNGLFQVRQLELIETIKQRLFATYAFEFADKLLHINLAKYNDYYLPETVNRFFDTQTLQKGLASVLKDIPSASIQILFGLILLSFYHSVFIVFGILIFLILFLILKITSPRGMASSIAASDYKYKVAGWLEELARTIRSFKHSRNEALHLSKTNQLVEGFLERRTAHFRILKMQYWSLIAFKLAITLTMLAVGVVLLTSQQLTIGQFVAAEIVILMVMTSVEKFIVDLDKVYDILTAIDKLGKISFSDEEEEGSTVLQPTQEGLSISVQDVGFSYADGKQVLSNIDLQLQPGERLLVKGKSGSGKSTLLRLLNGSYRNFSGRILVNHLPITSYQLSSLRNVTGLLLHQQDIFEGTIKENITMGVDVSPQAINKVVDLLELSSFISHSPKGIDTMLYPAGQHLPSTIIKKILVARALMPPRSLLLLEEPTYNLEPAVAAALMNYLETEMPNCTLIITNSDDSLKLSSNFKIVTITDGKIQ